MTPTPTAVVAVDVQGTFADDFPGAGLPVPGSGALVVPIAEFVVAAATRPQVVVVATTQDWHPPTLPGHIAGPGEAPDFAAGVFPAHGVAGTPEAELHPRFATPAVLSVVTHRVYKGQTAAAFSGFDGWDARRMTLDANLRAAGVRRVVVLGYELANCDAATAADAADLGYETWLVPELCSVLDPAGAPAVLGRFAARGVHTADPDSILDLLDREAAQ